MMVVSDKNGCKVKIIMSIYFFGQLLISFESASNVTKMVYRDF